MKTSRYLPDGATYLDKVWGYVMEKHNGKWVRQHRLKMEKKLGRKLRKGEVVHHKDHDRMNNKLNNLQLMMDFEHKSHHRKGYKHSKETRRKMSRSALKVASDPKERSRRSKRAKKQHLEGRFGYERKV